MALAAHLIQLDIPEFSKPAHCLAPPVNTVMGNIIPCVFNRNVFNRCLQHESETVKTVATVLLTLALEKWNSVKSIIENRISLVQQTSSLSDADKSIVTISWNETVQLYLTSSWKPLK